MLGLKVCINTSSWSRSLFVMHPDMAFTSSSLFVAWILSLLNNDIWLSVSFIFKILSRRLDDIYQTKVWPIRVGSDSSWGVLGDLDFPDEKTQICVADSPPLPCLPLTQKCSLKDIGMLLSPDDKQEHETRHLEAHNGKREAAQLSGGFNEHLNPCGDHSPYFTK